MTAHVLTTDEMKQLYGPFYDRGAGRPLDRRNVPEEFWCLLPYAEFWGVGDDKDRENLVGDAPAEAGKNNLAAVFATYEYPLNDWLAGPVADIRPISEEYAAVCELFMAADYAAP